jgi:hypothetical protein
VIEIGGAIDPFVGAGQRSAHLAKVELFGVVQASAELGGDRSQQGLAGAPVVERSLKGWRDVVRRPVVSAGAVDHDELPVAATIIETS